MATVQLEPPIGTSTWTAYHSSRYGLDLAYPADWIATPSRRAWTFKADAHDPSSPAMDQFRSPDGVLRVSYWSVPPGHEIGSRDDLAAWVVDYCTKTGQPCPGIHDVVTPLCVEHRDCHPALLVRFPDRVQAFAIGGVVGGDVTIVTVWRPESDPSVVRYGGATRLLEGFLATMGVYPPVLPDQP
jgi:hypothetical protein